MHCQAERPMMLQEWLGIMSCAGVVALHGGQDSIGQGRWANVRAWPHTHTVTGQPGWVRSRGATAAAEDATKAGSVGVRARVWYLQQAVSQPRAASCMCLAASGADLPCVPCVHLLLAAGRCGRRRYLLPADHAACLTRAAGSGNMAVYAQVRCAHSCCCCCCRSQVSMPGC